jgi:hypothetical protein
LIVDRVSDHLWVLDEDYQNPIFPDVTLKEGFEFDGASIPTICRGIISNSTYGVLEASATHDYLYGRGGLVIEGVKLTRKQVDNIFYHELRHFGIGWVIAQLAHKSVRLAGSSHWAESHL